MSGRTDFVTRKWKWLFVYLGKCKNLISTTTEFLNLWQDETFASMWSQIMLQSNSTSLQEIIHIQCCDDSSFTTATRETYCTSFTADDSIDTAVCLTLRHVTDLPCYTSRLLYQHYPCCCIYSWHTFYASGIDPHSGKIVYCWLGHHYHRNRIKVAWVRCWLVSVGIMMTVEGRPDTQCNRDNANVPRCVWTKWVTVCDCYCRRSVIAQVRSDMQRWYAGVS